MYRKHGKNPVALIEAAEKCVRAHGLAIDGPMPEPVDQALATAERQLAAAAAAAKARRQAAPKASAPETKTLTVAETLNGVGAEHQTKRRARNRPGPVAPKNNQRYLPEGNFYRMPNELIDSALLAIMPGPALKAYVLGHRLARIDGTFYVSAGTLAERIGA